MMCILHIIEENNFFEKKIWMILKETLKWYFGAFYCEFPLFKIAPHKNDGEAILDMGKKRLNITNFISYFISDVQNSVKVPLYSFTALSQKTQVMTPF